MLKALKITIFIILVLLLILFYMLFTDSGKKLSFNILNFVVTQKIGLQTKVTELDLYDYPYMKTELQIEKKYKLAIDGYYQDKNFDLKFTINSDCIQTDVCKIKDDVEINGTITGPRKALLIQGGGDVLDGNVTFKGTKYRRKFENLYVGIHDINSSNLFKLLGEKAIFEGSANGYLAFDVLSHESRKGRLYYTVTDKDYEGVEVDVEAQIDINNSDHNFDIKLAAPSAKINLIQGKYNKEKRKASAVFQIDIKNVKELKKVVNLNYNAPFYATGKLLYDNKNITMQGFSESLGGVLDLFFQENKLYFYLTNAPALPLMEKLEIDPIIDTNITGQGIYHIKEKTLLFDAKLAHFQFLKSKNTDSLLKSSDIDLSKEIFDNSSLHIEGKEKEFYTTLELKNDNNHMLFKDIKVNTKNDSIESFVDLHMYKYYLKGDLYFKIDKYTSSNDTYIDFDGSIQKHYDVTLKGLLNKKWTSMDYTLAAKRFPSHICIIEDDINVSGHINGPYTRLHVEGVGTALDGKVYYDGMRFEDGVKNLELNLENIHALKLSTLLGFPDLPSGKADIEAHFDFLDQETQKGKIHYVLRHSKLFKLPFNLDTHVTINNKYETFDANISLGGADIQLTDGVANLETKVNKALYTIDVKDLKTLEELLGYEYEGPFNAIGTVHYDGNYSVHGLTKTFDGLTEFNYEKDMLDIDLNKVSFKRIMGLFPYPKILDAQTTGKIHYDFKDDNLTVKTKLKDAHFYYFEEMDTLYQKSGINLLKERFTDSTLNIHQNGKDILVNLIMDSDTSHLSFTNTLIDTDIDSINSYFDIKMQGKEFTGKVYGPLSKPKINLNMQKLIRHEMDRQLDSIVGKGNREMMEAMPMGNVAKDVASGMGGAFMGIFF